MNVSAIRTAVVKSRSTTVPELVSSVFSSLSENSIIAISSKVVALCEGRTAAISADDKQKLIEQEAERYLPPHLNRYEVSFTIKHNTLIPSAGIDESNAAGHFVLWPEDPQLSANNLREYIVKHYGLSNIGIVITDSTARPLRWGMGGISVAHSGFNALSDYRGTNDLFGRTFQFETMDIAGGLAAAATLVMGEGAEQTPIALITDVPFVQFQSRNPNDEEIAALKISIEEDLYGSILMNQPWQEGGSA